MKGAAVFTRDNPCTKVHIWNAFRGPAGFQTVTVVECKAVIGDNTPKYLAKKGFMLYVTEGRVDYCYLTPAGQEWLTRGLERHLQLHPEDRSSLAYPVASAVRLRPRVRPYRSL